MCQCELSQTSQIVLMLDQDTITQYHYLAYDGKEFIWFWYGFISFRMNACVLICYICWFMTFSFFLKYFLVFPVFVKWKLCKVMNSRAIALEDIRSENIQMCEC